MARGVIAASGGTPEKPARSAADCEKKPMYPSTTGFYNLNDIPVIDPSIASPAPVYDVKWTPPTT